jgi:predicted HicB family RNase H-like nuclease
MEVKTERQKTSVYISKELHKRAKILAIEQERDLSELYEEALRTIIEKYRQA